MSGNPCNFSSSETPLVTGQTLELPKIYSTEPDDPKSGGGKKQSELLAAVAISGYVSRGFLPPNPLPG